LLRNIFIFILSLISASSVIAAGNPITTIFPHIEFGINAKADSFFWIEKDQTGRTETLEYGPRLGLGLTLNNTKRPWPGIIFEGRGNYYLGATRYEGLSIDQNTNAEVDANTWTNYSWINLQGMIGQRTGKLLGDAMLDFMVGGNIDYWSRELKAGTDGAGQQFSGVTQTFRIFTARAGVGLAGAGKGQHWRLQAGVKFPFHTTLRVSQANLTLRPGKDISYYGLLESNSLFYALGYKFHFSAYYEGYRFKRSPNVAYGGGVVNQAESIMHVFGVELQY